MRIMERFDLPLITKVYNDMSEQYKKVRQALCLGYFMQVAHKEGEKGNYLTVKDNQVRSHLASIRLSMC